ncbi:MAG: hypothetical protein GY714_09470 [Desulfobacterales bacterium]|nr:hypothetical protein [Desulfobacterales bacterium]MCP4161439.1 hypothetical protein [Deltaproteobacteria bacterium]
MNILNVEHFTTDDLIKRLRNLTMLTDKDTKPYEKAFISLENISVEELFPAQRYVLKKELNKVRDLKWALEEKGYDLFNLNGFVRLTLEGVDEPVDLLPPVVEERIERNGRIVNIINDGMHRVYSAYLEWVIPQVIYVRGLPKHLPYYAYAIPEKDWKQIELRDDIPKTFIKKWHRISENKKLYRDFNSTFENVGGPRGNTK